MSTQSVKLMDLDQVDRAELSELDRFNAIRFGDPEVDRTSHGELVTGSVLIAMVTVSALQTLAAWLNKKRQSETYEAQVIVVDENGREERRSIRWSRQESEAAQPEQLAALAQALSIDLTALSPSSP